MRVAALYDIHGNLPALDAVLTEVEREGFDTIVVGGDVFWGPWPAETLDRLLGLGGRVRFVLGNCDHETFEQADGQHAEANAWVAGRLDTGTEALVAGWPLAVELAIDGVGDVCFCHSTPRSDTEIVTPLTPEPVLVEALSGTDAATVVCGHVHVQWDVPAGRKRLVNAGSVGFGYEEQPGAYWLELGPEIRHRRTGYDIDAAAAALAALDSPVPFEPSDLTSPPGAGEVIAHFESVRAQAGA
jgi:predicted phosphodiesterase